MFNYNILNCSDWLTQTLKTHFVSVGVGVCVSVGQFEHSIITTNTHNADISLLDLFDLNVTLTLKEMTMTLVQWQHQYFPLYDPRWA